MILVALVVIVILEAVVPIILIAVGVTELINHIKRKHKKY